MMRIQKLSTTAVVLSIIAGLLIGAAGVSSAAQGVSPSLTPPAGQTAVKSGDHVTFGGTVDPGATLNRATLITVNTSGTAVHDVDVTNYANFASGRITGGFDLGGLAPGAVAIRLVVVADQPDGTQAS